MTELTPRDDTRKTVSEILKRVDQMIRTGSLDHALKETARAKEMDPRNVYIQAYEERIANLISERQRAAEQGSVQETPQAESDPSPSPELLQEKTDSERKRFQEEEKRAEDNLRKAAELKRKAEEELKRRRAVSPAPQQPPPPATSETIVPAPPAAPATALATQSHVSDDDKAMAGFLQRLKEEELRRRKVQAASKPRAEAEKESATEATPSDKYRKAVMNALTDGTLSAKEKEIIAKLKAELTISDDQATKLETEAKRDLYVRSFKDAWISGRISPENMTVLGDIRRRYSITANDHAELEAKILAAIATMEKKPRIMIVDDDEKLLMLLAESLDEAGFEPIALATSDEAFKLLRENPPDLIVSDINLETSTMGGFTFYEKVREIEELAEIPFIFLSGLTDEVLIRTGKELGVDDYITKPFSEDVLIATIRGKLRRFGQLKRKKK